MHNSIRHQSYWLRSHVCQYITNFLPEETGNTTRGSKPQRPVDLGSVTEDFKTRQMNLGKAWIDNRNLNFVLQKLVLNWLALYKVTKNYRLHENVKNLIMLTKLPCASLPIVYYGCCDNSFWGIDSWYLEKNICFKETEDLSWFTYTRMLME